MKKLTSTAALRGQFALTTVNAVARNIRFQKFQKIYVEGDR
jgi:hypothetical protein